jgi:hypothetical protein
MKHSQSADFLNDGTAKKLLYTVSRVPDIKSRACHGIKLDDDATHLARSYECPLFRGAETADVGGPVSIPLFC